MACVAGLMTELEDAILMVSSDILPNEQVHCGYLFEPFVTQRQVMSDSDTKSSVSSEDDEEQSDSDSGLFTNTNDINYPDPQENTVPDWKVV